MVTCRAVFSKYWFSMTMSTYYIAINNAAILARVLYTALVKKCRRDSHTQGFVVVLRILLENFVLNCSHQCNV